jgi:hypothetical protein
MKKIRIRVLAFGILALLIAAGVWLSDTRFLGEQSLHASPRVFERTNGKTAPTTVTYETKDQFQKREPWPDVTRDPFQIVNFIPLPPVSIPPQPAIASPTRPSAPQFPYRFFGRMVDVDGKILIFLIRDDILIPVRQQDILDGTYRIDLIKDTQIQITNLPLNEQSTLALPPTTIE